LHHIWARTTQIIFSRVQSLQKVKKALRSQDGFHQHCGICFHAVCKVSFIRLVDFRQIIEEVQQWLQYVSLQIFSINSLIRVFAGSCKPQAISQEFGWQANHGQAQVGNGVQR
jgi:hypothetical protein